MPKKIIQSDLSSRQINILFAIIKEYCDSGDTIGSKEIQERFNFDFSSATIRNEVSLLRKFGYLSQPFINSGSKPTEKAFKLFVTQLMMGLQITTKKQREMEIQLEDMRKNQEKLSREIAKMLSLNTGGVGFAVTNHDEAYSGTKNLFNTGNSSIGVDGSVSDILDFLDNLEDNKKFLLSESSENDVNNKKLNNKSKTLSLQESELKTFFGKDARVLSLGENYTMVATEITLDNGEKSVIGLITPLNLLTKTKGVETIKLVNQAFSKNLKNK